MKTLILNLIISCLRQSGTLKNSLEYKGFILIFKSNLMFFHPNVKRAEATLKFIKIINSNYKNWRMYGQCIKRLKT